MIKFDDLLGEYCFNQEQEAKLWKFLDERNIYGIFFEGIEFEPNIEERNKVHFIPDSASSIDVDKVYLKTFGWGDGENKGNFTEFTLRFVFELLELEFE